MDNLEIDYKKAAQQLRSGEALFGKDGALAPMLERILNAGSVNRAVTQFSLHYPFLSYLADDVLVHLRFTLNVLPLVLVYLPTIFLEPPIKAFHST